MSAFSNPGAPDRAAQDVATTSTAVDGAAPATPRAAGASASVNPLLPYARALSPNRAPPDWSRRQCVSNEERLGLVSGGTMAAVITQSRTQAALVTQFADITIDDIPSVGGKNASLGEMIRELGPKGVKVPDGFAVTADAYRQYLRENRLDREVASILNGLDTRDVQELARRGRLVRSAIVSATLPAELGAAVAEAYARLGGPDRAHPPDVAVRSSATAEDLPDASFAGQQETYLNVQGLALLLHTVKRCFASLFTDRAISYRVDRGFGHLDVALSVGVQRMVRADLGASGVMFTIDTETGFADVVLINAAYGLGENVVQGAVNPDEYAVFKPTLRQGFRPILQKKAGTKEFKLVYDAGGGRMVKNVPVPPDERARFSISDEEILTLARWGCVIEDHYSARRGRPSPMD